MLYNSSPDRRSFLKGSASAVAGGLFLAGPLVLTSRKAVAAQSAPLNVNVLTNLADAAFSLYQSGFREGGQFSYFSQQISVFHNYIASIGLDSTLSGQIPAGVNGGVMPFNGGMQNFAYQAAQAVGWANFLTLDFFSTLNAPQPTIAQVQVINSTTSLATVHYNASCWNTSAAKILNWSPGGGGNEWLGPRSSPNSFSGKGLRTEGQAKPTVTKSQAEIAAAAGGVFVASGIGLAQISGTTAAGFASAGLAASTAFTAGVALVVIGLGIAGYYGWQYIQSQQVTGYVNGMEVRQSIEAYDE